MKHVITLTPPPPNKNASKDIPTYICIIHIYSLNLIFKTNSLSIALI